jgi:hypothetical protein
MNEEDMAILDQELQLLPDGGRYGGLLRQHGAYLFPNFAHRTQNAQPTTPKFEYFTRKASKKDKEPFMRALRAFAYDHGAYEGMDRDQALAPPDEEECQRYFDAYQNKRKHGGSHAAASGSESSDDEPPAKKHKKAPAKRQEVAVSPAPAQENTFPVLTPFMYPSGPVSTGSYVLSPWASRRLTRHGVFSSGVRRRIPSLRRVLGAAACAVQSL